jgi:NTP pyrophosphatase (non-canonical NTP hydrolase)
MELSHEYLKVKTLKEYQELAMRTAVQDRSLNDSLIEAALGCVGEAGEIADEIKKNVYHDHPIRKEHLMKEAGDVLWYLSRLCNTLGTSLEEVATMNIQKLAARYPEGFSAERSLNRLEEDAS